MTSNLAHLAQPLGCAHHSVLCLVTEVTKPQNSEAVTLIIAEAREPICKHPIVETTKPPTYLFRFPSMSKSVQTKNQHRAILGAPPTSSPEPIRSALPLHRLGETASRESRREPQEEKSPNCKVFVICPSQSLVLLGPLVLRAGLVRPAKRHHPQKSATCPSVSAESWPKRSHPACADS